MNNNKILAVLSTSAFSAIVVTAIDDEKNHHDAGI